VSTQAYALVSNAHHESRQIPYAIGQFTVNELCHEAAFRTMSTETRAELSSASKLSISLGSGVIAGFAAAILSQPADTLLSQINKGHGPKGTMLYRLGVLSRQIGFRGLFAGLGPRMVMTAGLVSGQFLIYGAIKDGARFLENFPSANLLIITKSVSDGCPTRRGDP
jgi:solute carrier family 25 phosphate transporter 3